jgi:elongation of very long chain fatty acids protein 7
MSGPLPTLLICLSYVLVVKKLGPWWMRDRAPYDFRGTLVVYNGVQVIFSAWLFYEYGMGGWFNRYNFHCQPVDYSNDPVALRMVNVCWFYYFSKFTEFFDTVRAVFTFLKYF